MKDLSGKFAIVSGGGSSVGAAVVKRFLEENAACVAILDPDLSLAEQTARNLDPMGKRVVTFKCDPSDAVQVKAAVNSVCAAFDRVDILVNHVEAAEERAQHNMTEDWRAVAAEDLNGAYYLCKTVLPLMRKQGEGSMINVVSPPVISPPGDENGSASKEVLQGLTDALAVGLDPRNIRINCVTPGYICEDTPLAMPEKLAAVVAFLAGEDGSWVSGQTIFVEKVTVLG